MTLRGFKNISHAIPLVSFYIPWKYPKSKSFVIFQDWFINNSQALQIFIFQIQSSIYSKTSSTHQEFYLHFHSGSSTLSWLVYSGFSFWIWLNWQISKGSNVYDTYSYGMNFLMLTECLRDFSFLIKTYSFLM